MAFRRILTLVLFGAVAAPAAGQAPVHVPPDVERALAEALALVETTPDAGTQLWRLFSFARTVHRIRGPEAAPLLRRIAERQRQVLENLYESDFANGLSAYGSVLNVLAEVDPDTAFQLWDRRPRPTDPVAAMLDERQDAQFRSNVLLTIGRRTPERVVSFYRDSGEPVDSFVIQSTLRTALRQDKQQTAQQLVDVAYEYFAKVPAESPHLGRFARLLREMPELTPDRRYEGAELLVRRIKETDEKGTIGWKYGDREVQLDKFEFYTIELSGVVPEVVRLVPSLKEKIEELGGRVSIPQGRAAAGDTGEAQVVSPRHQQAGDLLPRLKAGPESLYEAVAPMSTNHDDIRFVMRLAYQDSPELLEQVQQASMKAIDGFEDPTQRLILSALWLTDGPRPMSAEVLEYWLKEAEAVGVLEGRMPGLTAPQWLQVRLLERWSREDPLAALEWIFYHPAEGRLQFRSLAAALKGWAERNARN